MIFSYHSPITFNKVTSDSLDNAHGVLLLGEQPESYQITPPKFQDDPDNCQIFPKLASTDFLYPCPYVLFRKDITLIGVRTILEPGIWYDDQDYLNEESLHSHCKKLTNYHDPFLNEWTGFEATPKIDTFLLNRNNRNEIFLRGRILVLSSLEGNNYGSLLFRVLPKLYFSQLLNLQFDYILIDNLLGKPKEFCELLGIDKEKIIAHDRNCIYHIEQAIIPSLLNPYAYLNKLSMNFYKDLRQKLGKTPSGKKIYISRVNHAANSQTTRILINEVELIEALKKENFQIICPELFSLQEQIEIFSSASIIVGPSGSGMFNTVFCHPGTKLIDIESEPHWIFAHTALFSSLELDYSIFVGKVDPNDPSSVHKKWSVNIPALINRIRSLG